MFTREPSLLRRFIPLRPPGLPSHQARPQPGHPDPARHPTRHASPSGLPLHPAPHPTLPATLPCLPAFPDSLAVLLSHEGVASVVTR